MAIHRGSRYQNVYGYLFVDSSGTQTLLGRRLLSRSLTNLTGSKPIKTYIWKITDRIDNVAYNEYGDSSLWWAILDANPQYMTPYDIQVGDVLTIPPYEAIRGAIGNG